MLILLGVALLLGAGASMVKDRRYKSGFRGNREWTRARVLAFTAGLVLILVGSASERREPLTDRQILSGLAPISISIAGIALGEPLEAVSRRVSTRCGSEEDAPPGVVTCEVELYFGGRIGHVFVSASEGRVDQVWANDNAPEQLAAVAAEFTQRHGPPTVDAATGRQVWTLSGGRLEYEPGQSLVLRR